MVKDRTHWKLNPEVFRRINRLGPLAVDLFASHLTTQLPQLKARSRGRSPECVRPTVGQAREKGYANPPWSLVGKTLSHVRAQRTTIVLVAPVWKVQVWYATLLEMLIDFPVILKHPDRLIQPTILIAAPEVEPQLAAWPTCISGNTTKMNKFLTQAQNCYWHHGGQSHPNHMTPSLENGCASVIRWVQIPLMDL